MSLPYRNGLEMKGGGGGGKETTKLIQNQIKICHLRLGLPLLNAWCQDTICLLQSY